MPEPVIVVGVSASPGIAVGPAHIHFSEDFYVVPRRIPEDEVEAEIQRLTLAVLATRADLEELSRRAREEIGEASVGDIFLSHLQLLNDTTFFGRIPERVRQELRNVEYILADEVSRLRERFQHIDDTYLADRFMDIADVCRRVQRKLARSEANVLQELDEPVIVVAHDLTPSDTMQLDRDHVRAFVTVAGGQTSHTAILAKALEIPAVLGAKAPLYRIRPGDTLIVDGYRGEITVHPDAEMIAQAEKRRAHVIEFEHELEQLEDLTAETTDHVEVQLQANIDLPDEITTIDMHGASGVGLYRTEYLFLNRAMLPDEEEQYRAYRQVAERFPTQPVTIRTLDVGADRVLNGQYDYNETNPVMGCRAIRFSLTHPDLFRTQLRAICRAAAHGNVRVMFPMITGLEEFRQARHCFEQAWAELARDNIPLPARMDIGAMIEVPSAVFAADLLAAECDFLSIGTNDLIQYTLAVDRVNELVAHLYVPAHPGIIRSLHHLLRAAEQAGTPVSLCGDLAGHPGFTMLLLGLGLREFSMVPAEISEIKRLVRSISLSDAQAVAAEALSAATASEIRAILIRRTADLLPEADFEWERWFERD